MATRKRDEQSSPVEEAVAINYGGRVITETDFTAIETFEQAWELANTTTAGLEDLSDYLPSLEVLSNKAKDKLVDVPFLIVDFQFSKGDYGMFVSARIITETGHKYVIIDGSTGIKAQLEAVAEKRQELGHKYPQGPLAIKGGLRKSEYWFDPETRKVVKPEEDESTDGLNRARTFYLQS